jgi:hypothetical protein
MNPRDGLYSYIKPRRLLVPRVRTRAGDHRSGDDRQGTKDPDRPNENRLTFRELDAFVPSGRLAHQDQPGSDEKHRQQEVTLIRHRIEVGEHDDSAEDDLTEHTHHQQPRESFEILPALGEESRREHGSDHQHGHHTGEEAIHLLDRPMDR